MQKIHICVKAVIFDMDGVITNTMPYHYDAWEAVLKIRGIHVNHYDVYRREGQPGIETIAELFKEHDKISSPHENLKVLHEKEEIFKKIVKIKYVLGARPFLRYLKNRNFMLGLVTGTSRKEVKKILPEKIYNEFCAIVAGDEAIKGKPNPEPFLHALKVLKVDPSDAVVIENAPFGILAAKKAKIKCIAIETSLPHRFLTEADMIFKSIDDLRKKVKFELLENH